jgi:hypothetical protein
MKPKYLLIAAAVATAVAAAHSLAVSTDRCTALGEIVCALAPPPPTDNSEHQPARAIIERSRGEQEPVTSFGMLPQAIATAPPGCLQAVVSYELTDEH